MKSEIKNLKYGSFENIRKAFKAGAGVFYRSDVEILMNIIEQNEQAKENIKEPMRVLRG